MTTLNILEGMFPFKLASDVKVVYEKLSLKTSFRYSDDFQSVKVDDQLLNIPARIYCEEPASGIEDNLSETQKTILNCLLLRHYNGYVRQKRLKMLLNANDYFIIPFKFQLLGEYVIEILDDLNDHITESTISDYARLICQNQSYFKLTENRVISYWDEYYRSRYPKFNNYVGKLIIDRLRSSV